MKALSKDYNWLKVIGIVLVLSATLLLSQCSQGYIYRSQANAAIAVEVSCRREIYKYEQHGRFLDEVEGSREFINAYPEFYSHSIRYAAGKVFYYATSKSPHLKSYVGLVVDLPKAVPLTTPSSSSAIAITCGATKPGTAPATDPIFGTSTLICGSQTQQVGALLTALGK